VRNAIVVGERIYLRPIEPEDGDACAAALTNEPDTHFERGRFPTSPLAFDRWIEEVYRRPARDEIEMAVCTIEPDRLIGLVGVDHLDWINRTAETGSYLIAPEFRDKGYGTEAKHLLLEYCFDRLHLHAVCSHVWEPNRRSAAALRKQGYRPAGRLKWDDLKDGVYRDTLVFDLLREEWLAAREEWRAGLREREDVRTDGMGDG
jgi:RimJ/RimL family protein N-acetyltransferase